MVDFCLYGLEGDDGPVLLRLFVQLLLAAYVNLTIAPHCRLRGNASDPKAVDLGSGEGNMTI